jgi:hypothetical protein
VRVCVCVSVCVCVCYLYDASYMRPNNENTGKDRKRPTRLEA